MKASEIRDLTADEIKFKLNDLKEEYFRLSFRHSVHKVDNPMKLRLLRKVNFPN